MEDEAVLEGESERPITIRAKHGEMLRAATERWNPS